MDCDLCMQLSSPENLRMLSNPRVMGAVMQIHQGFNVLQEELPDLYPAYDLLLYTSVLFVLP